MLYTQIPMADARYSTKMWRPWALRTRSLVGFICLCLLLLIGGVAVIFGCATSGCYVFGMSDNGNLPSESDFLYTQFPTILSVGLSFLWVVPHHDIIRLEPYFRMSARGGEEATASLFLEYPYDIALFVPFKALTKGHYVVALSSTILLLMNFFIVPILPNIFDRSGIVVESEAAAWRTSYIPGRSVTANITFSAYDHAWYNGTVSSFQTDEYAVLPVRPDGYKIRTNESWVVETTLFEGELQCVDALPPAIGYVNDSLTVNITSTNGDQVHLCDAGALEQGRIKFNNDTCQGYTAFITPWTSMSWELGSTAESPVSYMYAWASGPSSPPNVTENFTFPPPIDITAIFCVPVYYSEPVKATIKMSTMEVLNVTRLGQRVQIPSLRGFDGILDGNVETNFTGELLIEGLATIFEMPVRFGYPHESIANVSRNLLERFGSSSRPIRATDLGRASSSNVFMTRTDSLSSFSLFSHSNETLSTLLDAEVLQKTHEKALKMLFAFAMSEMVGDYPNNEDQVIVLRRLPTEGVKVNRSWALGAVIGLTVIILLTVLLVFLIRKRPCELDGEPDSLAASLRLLAASPGLCAAMRWAEYYKPAVLSEMMDARNLYFKLEQDGVNGGSLIRVVDNQGAEVVPYVELLAEPDDSQSVQKEKPWSLKVIIKIACLICLPIMLLMLVISFVNSRANDGFPMPGGPNTFRSKVLYNYLPTALSSSIEPILITLGATYCLMGPYRALETGNARYSDSLAVDYDKLPPQFQIHNSIKKREYTLLALSLAILLSNALPIAVVSLFSSSPQAPKIPRSHNVIHNFTTARQEMYYQMNKNLTSGFSPTWTTESFYIDPPYQVAPIGEGIHETIGFGIDISCTLVAEDRVSLPCGPQNRTEAYTICNSIRSAKNILAIENSCGVPNANISDWSWIYWDGTSNDGIMIGKRCPDRIFPYWAENTKYTADPPSQNDAYQFVVLNCSIADRIVDLSTNVKDGRVLSVTSVQPLDTERIASLYAKNASIAAPLSQSFVKVIRDSIAQDRTILGNHPIIRINSLIAAVNESVVREPRTRTHVPDGTVVVGAFETVMRGLFALLMRMSAEDIFEIGVDGGVKYEEEYRVHVDDINFAVATGVVLFTCGVLVALFFGQERKVMGHLPSTLAGVYSHLYHSNIKRDMKDVGGMDLKKIKKQSEDQGRRYGYGRYHGEKHHGVYRVPTESRISDPKITAVEETTEL